MQNRVSLGTTRRDKATLPQGASPRTATQNGAGFRGLCHGGCLKMRDAEGRGKLCSALPILLGRRRGAQRCSWGDGAAGRLQFSEAQTGVDISTQNNIQSWKGVRGVGQGPRSWHRRRDRGGLLPCSEGTGGPKVPTRPASPPAPLTRAPATPCNGDMGCRGSPGEWDRPGPQGNDVRGKGTPTPDPLLQVDNGVW